MNLYKNENRDNITVHERLNGHGLIKPLLLLLLVIGVFVIVSNGVYAISLTAITASPDTDTQVRLDWTPVATAKAYQLLRRTDPDSTISPDRLVATIDVLNSLDSLSYKDTGLEAETSYYYTIMAFSDTACTVLLEEMTVPVTTTAMITPYNVDAVFDINTKEVTLTWDVSYQANGCTITRYASDGTITELSADSTTSTIIYEAGIDEIVYTVRSEGGGKVSEESQTVTVQPIVVPVLEATSSRGGIAVFSNTVDIQPNKFRLARSVWDGSSWSNWVTVLNNFTNDGFTDPVSAGGQYRYRLEAHSGYSGYSNVTNYVCALGAPSGLTAELTIFANVWLSWTNAPGNTGSIRVLRRVGTSDLYRVIATLPADTEEFIDNDITVVPGIVYSYSVIAFESVDNYSHGETVSISETLPAAPTSLRADLSSPLGITLTWTDNADNEKVFVIERMTNPGQYQVLADVLPSPETSSKVTFLDDRGLVAGNTYIYRVRSKNALGYSGYSNEVTVSSWDTVAPATLTVTPISSSRLDLTWSYTGTTTYNTVIERKTGSAGTWQTIYTAPRGVLKYSDTGLLSNTQYFYRIRKSLGSNATGIAFPNDEIGKGAYTLLGNLNLSGDAESGNTIRLSWSGNTYADVIIERKMANGSFSVITTVSAYTNSWYDNTGLVPGASYTYRIKTQTSTNESLYSNECTVQNFYLEEPSNLSATVDSESTITLNWTDNSRDETGFEIWRYVYGTSEYSLYATVGQNITSYTDTKVTKGIQYHYKVRAYIAADSYYSPFSRMASTGVGLISPPSDLSYTYVSSKKVTLSWKDNSEKENGFKIERRIWTDGEWTVVSSVSRNKTSYTVSNLNPDIEYYFRVRAYTYSGNADAVSEEIMVSTALPIAPSKVTSQSVSASQVKITWQDNSDNEKGFRVLRRPSTSSTYTSVATVRSDATVYYDNTVVYGKRYYYKVAAYNDTGSSESHVAEVKTSTKSNFTDLGDVSWAKDAIESLAGLGIIKGVSDRSFAPNRTISKAEFTTILVRAFRLETAPIGGLADVKFDKWYYKDVMIAENLGVIAGDENNRFYPEAAITREEICVMIFKALQASEKNFTIHDNSVLERFIDRNNISPAAVSSMATLAGEGVIEGLPGNIIGPKYTATRAQAAVFLYRTLSKVSE